jgi:hypothetical protein
LRDQELTDSMRSLIHQARGHRDVVRAQQADDAIAQVLTLSEHERDQHQHDEGADQRREDTVHSVSHTLHRSQARRDHSYRLSTTQVCQVAIELFGDSIDRATELAQRRAVAGTQVRDFLAHRSGVFAHLRRQVRKLVDDHVAERPYRAQCQQHGERHTSEARQTPSVEYPDQRHQRERQDDAQCQGQQYCLCGPQPRDDQRSGEQRCPRPVNSGRQLILRHADKKFRRETLADDSGKGLLDATENSDAG